MADNYLENRMEELRSGRLQNANAAAAARPQKGNLNWKLPSKRVLVAGDLAGIGGVVARAFLRAGCRVGVVGTDTEAGEKLAHDDGARFYNTDPKKMVPFLESANNLLYAWKGLDIAICCNGDTMTLSVILNVWSTYHYKYQIPDDYVKRLITINCPRFALPGNHFLDGAASINHIHAEDDSEAYETAARLALFLSLPENSLIAGGFFPVAPYLPDDDEDFSDDDEDFSDDDEDFSDDDEDFSDDDEDFSEEEEND